MPKKFARTSPKVCQNIAKSSPEHRHSMFTETSCNHLNNAIEVCRKVAANFYHANKVAANFLSCKSRLPQTFTMQTRFAARLQQLITPPPKFAANLICMVKVCGNLAVLARRMTTFLTANQNIDTSVQKGGVPGFSGCFEHTSAISQIIHEAKVNNKELTVIWLDLDNSYGSIPHTLIDEALLHPRTYTGDRQWLF